MLEVGEEMSRMSKLDFEYINTDAQNQPDLEPDSYHKDIIDLLHIPLPGIQGV